MGAIQGRSIQAEGEHKCFFNFLIICLYISFEGVVCFRGHIFNVEFPIKVITNGDSKVLSIFS